MLYIDTESAIELEKNLVFHDRRKHIDIHYHFIRECIEREEIVVKHVSTELQRADTLTKALATVRIDEIFFRCQESGQACLDWGENVSF